MSLNLIFSLFHPSHCEYFTDSKHEYDEVIGEDEDQEADHPKVRAKEGVEVRVQCTVENRF